MSQEVEHSLPHSTSRPSLEGKFAQRGAEAQLCLKRPLRATGKGLGRGWLAGEEAAPECEGKGTSAGWSPQSHRCVCSVVSNSATPDCHPPGSSVHGTSQARILERVAISYSRGSSQPRDQISVSCISCIGRRVLYPCTTWEATVTFSPSKCLAWSIPPPLFFVASLRTASKDSFALTQ